MSVTVAIRPGLEKIKGLLREREILVVWRHRFASERDGGLQYPDEALDIAATQLRQVNMCVEH